MDKNLVHLENTTASAELTEGRKVILSYESLTNIGKTNTNIINPNHEHLLYVYKSICIYT